MKFVYFEDTALLAIDFEIDPEQQVGREINYTTNEQTIIVLDEAGNVLSVEVTDYAKRLYVADPVTVRTSCAPGRRRRPHHPASAVS